MSGFFRVTAAGLLTILVGSGQLVSVAQASDSAEGEAGTDRLLRERLASIPESSPWPDSWFQPRGLIAGAEAPRSIGHPDPGKVPAGLQQAAAYSKSQGGRGFVVWKDGDLAMAEFEEGFSATDPFNSYHMHWLPLVLAVAAARDDGSITSFDDPVSIYLPEWRGDPRGEITIRQLLNMCSGLKLYRDSSDPANPASHVFFGSERARSILDWPMESAPGAEFEYNYIVPEVLGLVLERATGRRYPDYLSEHVWRPVENGDAEVWLDRPGGSAYHNAALFAAPRDWLGLGILLANRGQYDGQQVIDAATFEELVKPSPCNQNFGFLALGSPHLKERWLSKRVNYYSLVSEPLLAGDVIIVDGYLHRLFAVPSLDLVVLHVGTPGRATAARIARWDDAALLNPVLGAFGAQ